MAIGQIVGRGYRAVRYQPTACIVLNCPTHDPKLCAEIRTIWASKDARRKLFRSLLTDYSTEGLFNGDSLDGWYDGSDLQCAAALRLLYYFPKETAGLLASRLDNMDFGKDSPTKPFARWLANGVRPDSFVKSAAWSKDPAVRAALVRVFKRAEDLQSLLETLPAIEEKESIRKRLEPVLAAVPANEEGAFGDGYHILTALATHSPNLAKPAFDGYLRNASALRCYTVCQVLERVPLPCDVELLRPLLTDQRTFGWTYAVSRGGPRKEIRVCDAAASALASNHPEFVFTHAGEYADLDKQIAIIREQLARKK